MKRVIEKTTPLVQAVVLRLETWTFLPIFGLRVWIAAIFWKSGLTKIGDWKTTVALFEEEYRVPLLPAELAAFMATAAELAAPIMLVLGFGSRVGALMLLAMTAVIEFTYGHFDQHIIWALVLLLILLHGPGKLSADYHIRRYCFGRFTAG